MFGQGIHATELLLLVLVSFTALLAAAAQRFKIPYPIFLVIGGLVLSLIPLFPAVSLSPTFVFLVVLPPLLDSSALQTSWREFRANLLHILMLAFGGVAFTVAGVAFVTHLLLPGFDLATGAVLGAVVSATDAISASAIGRRVGLPPEMLDIIEGESLVNDAAGLLALQFTVALVTSRTVPTLSAGIDEFLLLVFGGISAGLVVGAIVYLFQRPVQGSALQTLVSLATPYFAYLLGESIHASGVLATVVCGLYIGRKSSFAFTSEARLQSYAVWDTIEFGLNGIVFMLIGLQLPSVLDGIRPLKWPDLIGGAAFICILILVLRMLWAYAADWAVRALHSFRSSAELKTGNPRKTFVIGWGGMRGVITLAGALSLPFFTDDGTPFPHRAGIIFLAFASILVSLTGQGLSLPWIIRKLNVCASARMLEEERWARRKLINAALAMLESIKQPAEPDGAAVASDKVASDQVASEMIGRYYRQRLDALQEAKDAQGGQPSAARQQQQFAALSARLRSVERNELNHLEVQGSIGGETHRKLQRELDLLDLRYPGA